MKKSDKKAFIVMMDLHDPIKIMTDEEVGKLFKAEIAYWREEEYELPRDLSFAFCAIKNQFDRDWEKWVAVCEKNKSNGKKGGRPKNKTTQSKQKNPVGFSETEVNPKKPDKDKDKDKDSESDIDSHKKSSAEDLSLAEFMYTNILTVAPKTKKPNINNWASTIRLMRARDGLTHSEIKAVFMWANSDQFWSTNILSPEKLRKQFPTLHAQLNKNKPSINKHAGFADRDYEADATPLCDIDWVN